MGTLEYALLGLLKREKLTGYDLTKRFENNLVEFWHAKHSQIYPELKQLTEAGYVVYDIEISGNVLEKKVYSITPKGEEHFNNWIRQNTIELPSFKDEFKLKMFFCDLLTKEEQIGLVTNELNLHQKKLKHLKDNAKNYAEVPTYDKEALANYLVLQGGIKREEMYCSWLKEVLAIIDK